MKKNNTILYLRLLYLFCHILVVLGFIYLFEPMLFLCGVGLYFIYQIFGVSIGIHRYLAHGGFKMNPYKEKVILLLSILSGVGSPISWAGVHRLHHQKADGQGDPHDPSKLGFLRILLGSYNSSIHVPVSLTRDLIKKDSLRWVHQYYFRILFFWLAMLFLLDVAKLVWLGAWPICLCYWATSVGIFLNHKWGYRNYNTNDRSVNSVLLSLYTLGDGWHNNHHYDPTNYRHGVKWWEFDLSYHIIKGLLIGSRDDK